MGNILDACLSISLLPTIYQSLMNINSEYLFKILYPLLFSVAPLVIYIISKKYIGNFYAFLASFFFMSQLNFMWTAVQARTNTAILFLALVVMVLFSNGISKFARRLLIIIFTVSVIASHYSTTYIFFFVLLLTLIGMEILPRLTPGKRKPIAPSGNLIKESSPLNSSEGENLAGDSADPSEDAAPGVPELRPDKGITITFVALFFVILFFWYSQVTETAFQAGVGYVNRTLINLNQMFIMETRGMEVAQAYGQTLAYSAIPARVKFVSYWLGIVFIAIGVLSTLVGYKRMVAIPGPEHSKANFLKSKIDAEYWVLSLACCTILALSVILPYALHGYGMSREYLQMMVVLSIFLVIGGIMVGKFLKVKYWLLLAILITYFMCSSGTIDKIFGAPGSVVLNSEGPSYTHYYVHDQEGYAARWLQVNTSPEDRVVYTDTAGNRRLTSQSGMQRTGGDLYSLLEKDGKIDGYIYLTYNNVVNKELFDDKGHLHSLKEYQDKFTEKDKIYSNGGSEIYR